MSPYRASSILSRLRLSSRLAVFVLALFVLKIGAAAACTGHDFADLGLGASGEHAAQMESPKGKGSHPASTGAHTGNCSHASSHQVVDLASPPVAFVAVEHSGVAIESASPAPSRVASSPLRPPIV